MWILSLIHIFKVDEIVPRDSYAFVDKPGKDADGQPDLITEQVENFKMCIRDRHCLPSHHSIIFHPPI